MIIKHLYSRYFNFTINKGDVFRYKDTEITLNDSLFIKDQNLTIKRYPLNQAVASIRSSLSATQPLKEERL